MIDLDEAGRRLAGHAAGPRPPVSELRRRWAARTRRRRLAGGISALAAAAALALVVALVVPGPGRGPQEVATSPGGSAPNRPAAGAGRGVSATLHLDRTTVPAGTPIHATFVLDNATGRTLKDYQSCDGWLDVGVSSSRIPYEPATGAVACGRPLLIRPGTHRYPVTVMTTYQACTQAPSQATLRLPPCTVAGMPALPVGGYTTKVVTPGFPTALHLAAPIAVTLTAR